MEVGHAVYVHDRVCKNSPVWISAFRYVHLLGGMGEKNKSFTLHTLQGLNNVILQRVGYRGKRIILGKQDKNIVLYLQSMMDTVAKHQ